MKFDVKVVDGKVEITSPLLLSDILKTLLQAERIGFWMSPGPDGNVAFRLYVNENDRALSRIRIWQRALTELGDTMKLKIEEARTTGST